MKTWTVKTLHQIETYGYALYRDARIENKVQLVTIDHFPDRFYIDHVEWKTTVVHKSATTFTQLDQQTVTAELTKLTDPFKSGLNVYVSIGAYNFCLIRKKEDPSMFYWYDPNGVEDANKEARASVCCFSGMDLVVSHILKICTILQSVEFIVNFIRCRAL